jgi:hypothetical protein
MGVIGIAVAARIPCDNTPSAIGEHGGEDIKRAGEIESAVDGGDYRCINIAPLVHGKSESAAIDMSCPVRRAGPREAAHLIVVRHETAA